MGGDLAGAPDFVDLFRGFEDDAVGVEVALCKGSFVRNLGVVAFFPFLAASAPAGIVSLHHVTDFKG